MDDKKIITVITTVYNKAKYLKTWAESLSKQTYLDRTKILVIEDCSTDDSLKLLKKYIKEYNLDVNLQTNKKNMGLLYTIRRAYRQLDTKYFAVLDADDYYLSPEKIKKAVKFLEAHDDYSAYACNCLAASSESSGNPVLPNNVPNQTFPQMRGTPFFQTSSTTFRNNFTPKLLDLMDYLADKKDFETLRGDAFRNCLAFGYGKCYFENSVDSFWRCNVGIWGTLSKLEQDLMNMRAHWELFDFYRTHFGRIDANSQHLILLTANFYITALNVVTELMKDFSFFKFECKQDFHKNLKKYSGSDDREKILSYLFQYGKNLSDMGLIVNKQ